MAWRGVHISRPARLSHARGQMVIAQDDGEVRLPLEDVAWVILETPQVTLTGSLLSALTCAGVALIVSDLRHIPSGMLLPFHRHHAQAHVARLQVGITRPLRKRLWQAIVIAKIENQAALLAALNRSQSAALYAMVARVRSGDPANVEARAARLYWPALFADFRRGDEGDRRNALLNYGYAVARAALARTAVASGLLPALGLHHTSRTNPFNLVDDLLEPFRPAVDRLVQKITTKGETGMPTVEERQCLAGVLTAPVTVDGCEMTVLAASELAVTSLVRAFEAREAGRLLLPVLNLRG